MLISLLRLRLQTPRLRVPAKPGIRFGTGLQLGQPRLDWCLPRRVRTLDSVSYADVRVTHPLLTRHRPGDFHHPQEYSKWCVFPSWRFSQKNKGSPPLYLGQYLLRVEQIALHLAETYQGAQFYLGYILVYLLLEYSSAQSFIIAALRSTLSEA